PAVNHSWWNCCEREPPRAISDNLAMAGEPHPKVARLVSGESDGTALRGGPVGFQLTRGTMPDAPRPLPARGIARRSPDLSLSVLKNSFDEVVRQPVGRRVDRDRADPFQVFHARRPRKTHQPLACRHPPFAPRVLNTGLQVEGAPWSLWKIELC